MITFKSLRTGQSPCLVRVRVHVQLFYFSSSSLLMACEYNRGLPKALVPCARTGELDKEASGLGMNQWTDLYLLLTVNPTFQQK